METKGKQKITMADFDHELSSRRLNFRRSSYRSSSQKSSDRRTVESDYSHHNFSSDDQYEDDEYDYHKRYNDRKDEPSSRVYRNRAVSDSIRYDCDVSVDSIVVYLLTNRPKDKNIRKLVKFFRHNSFFDLIVADIPPPPSVDVPNTMTENQAVEIYRFDKVLTEAANRYPDKYVLIIKDKTVTVTTPVLLQSVIEASLQLAGWQFCFLNRWLDACEQYTNKVNVGGKSMSVLVKTMSPNSTLSILFSPRGRDIVIGRKKMNNCKYFTPISVPLGEKLNREIVANNISAICTVPNQFDYNLFDATNVSDLGKLCDCRRPEAPVKTSGFGNIPFIWFIVIIVVAFLLMWALFVLGPSNRKRGSGAKELEVELSEG